MISDGKLFDKEKLDFLGKADKSSIGRIDRRKRSHNPKKDQAKNGHK